MTKPTRMSEDELKALTDLEIRNAVGYYGGKLAEQRRKATYYYLGLPEGDLTPPEVDGRSSVVDPFVRNTIEAMLPQLMVKFTGGDSVVEFEPTQRDDEPKAKLCTDYLNYLFWKKNRGHLIAETWMRDALLYKNGIIKIWWDTRVEETKEEYKGLSQVELAQIMEDEEVEVTEQKSYPDEDDAEQRTKALERAKQQLAQAMQVAQQPGPQPNQQAIQAVRQLQQHIAQIEATPPVMLFDITCIRSKKGGKLSIDNVPPEEFLISRKAKSIATASFVGHRVPRSISDLRSMGYKDLDDVSGDDQATPLNAERMERQSYDDEQAYLNVDNAVGDESQRMVWVTECYIRCDWDGDGISELRKVTRLGNRILDNEEVDIAPFADIVCIRQPHKFFGLSIMDLGQETQKTKTSILRSQLDNMYLQVNGRYFAVDNQVNLDDLLTSRPGGVVRIKQPGAVGRLDQAMGDANAGMGMLEYMEGFGESATGWTRSSQGNSAAPLMNSTATAANIVANRDDMRVDLIARNFAEGFVELFRQMLKLVCQHQDKSAETKLNGQWVDIDPREWRNQFDVNINVGLGLGSKDQQVAHMLAIIGQQEKVHAIGAASPSNIYNASVELAKAAGQKFADKFFTDPGKQPPAPPKPDPEMVKGQVAMQLEQAKGQTALQVAQAEGRVTLQIEQQKAQLQAEVDMAAQRAQGEQATQQQQIQAALEREKAQMQLQLDQAKVAAENEVKFAKIQADIECNIRDNETKLLIARMGHEAAAMGQAASQAHEAEQAEKAPESA